MEEPDDLLCATASVTELLKDGRSMRDVTLQDANIMGEISDDVVSIVSSAWMAYMKASSAEFQRHKGLLEPDAHPQDELLNMDLESPHPTPWRRCTKLEMLCLYQPSTGRVTRSLHSKSSSSNELSCVECLWFIHLTTAFETLDYISKNSVASNY